MLENIMGTFFCVSMMTIIAVGITTDIVRVFVGGM